jgi:uncharacterized protein YcbK (DUF882 family)
LAQWTYWTRKQNLLNYAKQKGESIGDLTMQLEFLIKELKESYNSVYNTLKSAKSVREASDAVLLKFERPADMSTSAQLKRAGYGENYYNKYSNNKEGGKVSNFAKGRKTILTKNFKSTEFDCHGKNCCSTTIIDPKLVEYLQIIRDHFGKPITITSAYRCETHNRNIGGATRSYHVQGKAADIVVSGVASREVAKYAESIGILGIGLYETAADGFFTHIDTRTTKSFWYGQKEQYRSTFGGAQQTTPVNPEPSVSSSYHKSKNKYTIKLIYLQKGDRGRDVQIL